MEVLVKCITKTISITELQKSFQVLYEVKISNAMIFPHFFFSDAPPVLHMAKIQYNASRHKLHIEIYNLTYVNLVTKVSVSSQNQVSSIT